MHRASFLKHRAAVFVGSHRASFLKHGAAVSVGAHI